MHQGRRPVKSLESGSVAEGRVTKGLHPGRSADRNGDHGVCFGAFLSDLSTAITGIESARDASERLHEINRLYRHVAIFGK